VTIFTVCLQGESRFCFLVVKEFSVLSMLPLLITELSVEIRKMESQMFVYVKFENISFKVIFITNTILLEKVFEGR